MRVVFMGTPEYAGRILESVIASGAEVVGVFTQPDKPVGRKQILTPPYVKTIAEKHNIPVFQPVKISDEVGRISSLKPDILLVAAYGQILPKDILDIALPVNLHASILPKYRGASPIQAAILNRDRITGVTAMKMDVGLDTGDILGIAPVNIEDTDTIVDVYEKIVLAAQRLTVSLLKNINQIRPVKQNDADASYCKKITKRDGLISFKESSVEIYTKYRAYVGWPGVYLKSGLKLISIENIDNMNGDAGQIIKVDKESIYVACGKGAIRIIELQPPGKKVMKSIEYINGKRLKIGAYLE